MTIGVVSGDRGGGLAVEVGVVLVPVLLESHRLADLQPLALELVVLVLLSDVLPLRPKDHVFWLF